ncbi:hypothetical protein KP509_1Z184100 [Ceratopteris richardii]|nr:hypothetical protein KP509_1Z184100 [Ceratopteris richardii]
MLLARSFSVVESWRTLYTLKGMAQTAKDKASGAAQATQEKTQQLKENAAEGLSHAGEAVKGAMGKVTGNIEETERDRRHEKKGKLLLLVH